MSMPMWEHELRAEATYRMERVRETAAPRGSRPPGRIRQAWRARRAVRPSSAAPEAPAPLDLGPAPLGA